MTVHQFKPSIWGFCDTFFHSCGALTLLISTSVCWFVGFCPTTASVLGLLSSAFIPPVGSFTPMICHHCSTDYLISKLNPTLPLAPLCHIYKHILEPPAFKVPACSQINIVKIELQILPFCNHLISGLGIISIS